MRRQTQSGSRLEIAIPKPGSGLGGAQYRIELSEHKIVIRICFMAGIARVFRESRRGFCVWLGLMAEREISPATGHVGISLAVFDSQFQTCKFTLLITNARNLCCSAVLVVVVEADQHQFFDKLWNRQPLSTGMKPGRGPRAHNLSKNWC